MLASAQDTLRFPPASSDRDGSRTRITHPDNAMFYQRYDGLDRPTNLADQTETRFIEGYNQYGTHTGVLRNNGTFTSFGYDPGSSPGQARAAGQRRRDGP